MDYQFHHIFILKVENPTGFYLEHLVSLKPTASLHLKMEEVGRLLKTVVFPILAQPAYSELLVSGAV